MTGNKKAETHERIVREAAKAIRREGFAGTSVGDVMKAAGLTHGGFYAHFPSREAMLAEGLDCAAAESIETLAGAAQRRAVAEDISPLEALVDNYLSDRHLAATETGCTIASLGSETRRQSPGIRAVATERIAELIKVIERYTGNRERALAAIAELVGALVIARISDDPLLTDEIRAAAKAAIV